MFLANNEPFLWETPPSGLKRTVNAVREKIEIEMRVVLRALKGKIT